MKGFIDLFFCFQGKYFILDWKTNALKDYTQASIWECMRKNRYDLQASIYASAIKRYLSLWEKRPFTECFGGAIYFFLRGGEPLLFKPDLELAQEIDIKDLIWKEE
jgi:exodeoxyribonuclease V beta subunit